jgi:hypothetical protein
MSRKTFSNNNTIHWSTSIQIFICVWRFGRAHIYIYIYDLVMARIGLTALANCPLVDNGWQASLQFIIMHELTLLEKKPASRNTVKKISVGEFNKT